MRDSKRCAWDYTQLADAYVYRPQYAEDFVDAVLARGDVDEEIRVADIGAGTGNLTELLLERACCVDAVEPNAAMRRHGIERTARFGPAVTWFDATAEETGLPHDNYDLVSFGSSFNVVDPQPALEEAAAILHPGGWLMCCWNHRDADDPLQREIEAVIRRHLPQFSKGTRAGDPAPVIAASGFFGTAEAIEHRVVHTVSAREWVKAWWSHATLARQAGDRMEQIVADIGSLLAGRDVVEVPYFTKGWLARAGS